MKKRQNVKNTSDVAQSVSYQKETFEVGGMSCASCANTIQKTLVRLEGVKSAVVDLATSSATVEYDPNTITPDNMQEAVESIGYEFDVKGSGKEHKSDRGGCC